MTAIPTELLRKIIGYATDLDKEYDSPHAQHLPPPSGKKSLKAKRVSRLVRDIAAEFLYASITIKSPNECFALKRTLDSEGSHLARYIRSIEFPGLWNPKYPMPEWNDDALHAIGSILRKVSGLVAFSFKIFVLSYDTDPSQQVIIDAFNSIPGTVQHIHWSARFNEAEWTEYPQALILTLNGLANFRSLSLNFICSYLLRIWHAELSLPTVTHLCLVGPNDDDECPRNDEIIPQNWSLPALTHAHNHTLPVWNGDGDPSYPTIISLSISQAYISQFLYI